MNDALPLLFSPEPHPLAASLGAQLPASPGALDTRHFPDGESYVRIATAVQGRACLVLADLSHPDHKYLPLVFLASTLRELGARSVGLIAPYLGYLRQDRRFVDGEAVTSKIFARQLSAQFDWLVTVDPHLHRYRSLDEIYTIPSRVVAGAPVITRWLQAQREIVLVGPDEESEQWVSAIAQDSGHPYVIGRKQRRGDRDVTVTLPDLSRYRDSKAVIIDDVISSGQTIAQCILALKAGGIRAVSCAAVHGIFADASDQTLMQRGLDELVASNSIVHERNTLDLAPLLLEPIRHFLASSQ